MASEWEKYRIDKEIRIKMVFGLNKDFFKEKIIKYMYFWSI